MALRNKLNVMLINTYQMFPPFKRQPLGIFQDLPAYNLHRTSSVPVVELMNRPAISVSATTDPPCITMQN